MHANDLTAKWQDKTLSHNDIFEYLLEDAADMSGRDIPEQELHHIAECCHHLYLWSVGKLPSLGDFLTAVVKNDLMKAVSHADRTNMRSLWVYAVFIYNVAPVGWNKKEEKA